MTNNEIIVKVGKKSKLRFSQSKVYRAIDSNDLEKIAKNHKDCHIVIIESIDESEQDAIKKFALNFKSKNTDNSVLFYIPDEDDITSGIADELDYNIYLTLKDLYNVIYEIYSLNVSPFIDDKKRLNSLEIQDSIPEGMTDIFGSFGDAGDDELNSILNTSTIEVDSNENTTKSETTESEKSETTESEKSEAIENKQYANNDFKQSDKERNTEEHNNLSEQHTEVSEQHTEVSEQHTEVSEQHTENEENSNTESKEVVEHKSEQTEQLKTNEIDSNEFKQLQKKYDIAVNDIREANARVSSLETMLKQVKDEKKALENHYDELISKADILENPVSLSEYQVIENNYLESIDKLKKLNKELANKDLNIKDLTKELSNTKESLASGEAYKDKLEKYESEIETYKKKLDVNETKISEYETKIQSLQSDLNKTKDELNKASSELTALSEDTNTQTVKLESDKEVLNKKVKQLESKVDTITSERDNLVREVEQLRKEIKQINLDNTQSNSELSTLRIDLEDKTEQIETYLSKIKELQEQVTTLSVYELEAGKVSGLEEKLKVTTEKAKGYSKKLKEQQSKIIDLETQLNTTTKKLELNENYAETEKNSLQATIDELKAKLVVAEEQLQQKENQYNSLLVEHNTNASGTEALMSTNVTLENLVKSLREKVTVTTKELNTVRKRENDLRENHQKLQLQYKQVSSALNSIGGESSSTSVVDPISMMKPISYSGSAKIIPVIGSGSIGITTTAMSVANKLGATSRVLYLDFDLVNANADAWFSKMPLCMNVPGIPKGDRKATGLGIFFEQGAQTFVNYFDNIVNKCEKTKGGGVDYISGVYYRVDPMKIIQANYSVLFNLLGQRYQYIVIDFGRLGCSDVIDKLIKNVIDISNKVITVTTSDKFDVRNFKAKLIENNIADSKVAWLVNMCDTTNVPQDVKKVIGNAKLGLILRDPDLYGKREKFTRTKLNKDRLEMFIQIL